jgi:hypothetical protein
MDESRISSVLGNVLGVSRVNRRDVDDFEVPEDGSPNDAWSTARGHRTNVGNQGE